ncbi:hypothetical protein KBD69_05480 [Candidatus Woesebacteria bacterium]|nr:hypothetical protein [Candidatus Woesebacteria bacterium]
MALKTLKIENSASGVNLTFKKGEGKAENWVLLNGVIGHDVITGVTYQHSNNDILRSYFDQFGGADNKLKPMFYGAVLFEAIIQGKGDESAPIVLEELVKLMDDVLFGEANDTWDPDMEDELLSMLVSNTARLGEKKDAIVWERYSKDV